MKACYEFDNDPMKYVLKLPKKKVVHRIKYIKTIFYCVDYDFLWSVFCHEFAMFGHVLFFSPSL